MMYDYRLDIFIKVAETGSFSRAAKELFVTQPALTKQILRLEKSVGFPLFDRTHTGVTLTEAGRSFYQDAKNLIQYSTEAIERAQTIARVSKEIIRIGCFSSVRNLAAYVLPVKIQKYKPFLEVQLVEYPGKLNHESIVKSLQDDIFDVVEFGYNERMQADGLVFSKLYETKVSFEVPPDHPLAKKRNITIDDLAGQKFYIPARGNCYAFDQTRDLIENEVPSVILANDTGTDSTTMAKCQSEGYILVLFHRSIDNFYPLVSIPVPWDIPLDIGLIYREDAADTVTEFVQLAQKIFGEENFD